MKVPMFSVVVPIYNVEKYLRLCIESILAQKCQDWELILVEPPLSSQEFPLRENFPTREAFPLGAGRI